MDDQKKNCKSEKRLVWRPACTCMIVQVLTEDQKTHKVVVNGTYGQRLVSIAERPRGETEVRVTDVVPTYEVASSGIEEPVRRLCAGSSDPKVPNSVSFRPWRLSAFTRYIV